MMWRELVYWGIQQEYESFLQAEYADTLLDYLWLIAQKKREKREIEK